MPDHHTTTRFDLTRFPRRLTPAKLAPAAIATALLAAAGPARADAVADFKTGTDVMVAAGTANVGALSMTTGSFAVTKVAGSLDIALDAADLGLPTGATVHLHGVPTAGGGIVFSIDDVYDGVTIGPEVLTRVTGTLTAVATRIPGTEPPQIGDVRLRFASPSALVAYGSWGSLPITFSNLEVIGGIPQPALASLVSTGDGRVCSDSVDTVKTFAVWLSDPAMTGGAAVDFSVPHQELGLPSQIVISPGHRSTTVAARVRANFTGTVRVTAAGAGETRTFDVAVLPKDDCATAPSTKPAVAAWLASKIAGCANCTTFGAINHASEQLTAINGLAYVIENGKPLALLREFPSATAIDAVAMTDDGTITGLVTLKGVALAYRANMNHGQPVLSLLGAMTPTAINNYDVVVGYRVIDGVEQATYASSAGKTVPFKLSTTYPVAQSRALDLDDRGRVIGTYVDRSGIQRGWRWVDGTTTTLPNVGVKPALPVAINSVGQIAVIGADEGGHPISAIVSPTGSVKLLGLPPNMVAFQVKSINRYGAVVGLATNSRGTTAAYVWKPTTGFQPLTSYVTGLAVADVRKITDANKVVVTGTLNGAADTFLLTL